MEKTCRAASPRRYMLQDAVGHSRLSLDTRASGCEGCNGSAVLPERELEDLEGLNLEARSEKREEGSKSRQRGFGVCK